MTKILQVSDSLMVVDRQLDDDWQQNASNYLDSSSNATIVNNSDAGTLPRKVRRRSPSPPSSC